MRGMISMEEKKERKLLVLWTSGERETAMNMVLLYSLNSLLKGWWDSVTVLVWGASTELLSDDKDVQASLKKFLEAGGETIACKKCAENLGVEKKLEELGVSVFYTGQYLTEALQSGASILTV